MGDRDSVRWGHASPCPVCGRKGKQYCAVSPDGVWARCRFQSAGATREKQDRSGVPYYLHRLAESRQVPPPAAPSSRPRAAACAVLDQVYCAALERLPLRADHRRHLLARGLTEEQIDAGNYRSLPGSEERARLLADLHERFGSLDPWTVPGLTPWSGRWSLVGHEGLIIPVRDDQSRVVGLRIRPDDAGELDQGKYRWASCKKGASPPAKVHLPLGCPAVPLLAVRVTEGELKADVATALSGVPTLGVAGVDHWKECLPLLRLIGARVVHLAFDRDQWTNHKVARCLVAAYLELCRAGEAGLDVRMATWGGGAKGIDDALRAGVEVLVLSREESRAEVARVARNAGVPFPEDAKGDGATEKPPGGWRFRPMDSRTFFAADCRPTWLVKRLFVAGQAGIVGAPQKTLKTSLVIDLAVSLASGKPFLGHFDVYERCRVFVISGESGHFSTQDVARRVCRSRGIEDPGGLPIGWQFDLPCLANPLDLAEMETGLAEGSYQFVVIDPLYLSLLGAGPIAGRGEIQTGNIFHMGPLLLGVAQACLRAGATPLIVHHASRPASRKLDEPLELTDLAFAGIPEFAGQWLLVNRRETFAPGSPHKLRVTAGGRCGQQGQWSVDVEEGTLAEDFTGRVWDVGVQPIGEAIKGERSAKDVERQEKKSREVRGNAASVLLALDGLDPDGRGYSANKVVEAAGLTRTKGMPAILSLAQEEVLELLENFEVSTGRGNKGTRTALGIRRKRRGGGSGESLFGG